MEQGDRRLLDRIERYLDAVPRSATRQETVGPFTLFVQESAWPYYARPALGGPPPERVPEVIAVLDRQRDLGLLESIEWVDESCPALMRLARDAGLEVQALPLMVLKAPSVHPTPSAHAVRLLGPDDGALAAAIAVANLGFAAEGTAVGVTGASERDAAASTVTDSHLAFSRDRLRAGRTVTAIAEHDGGPIGVGSHQPIADVTEVVGVATLPAFRRRGIGAALTAALVADARQRGVDLILLSAGSEEIARMYARVGFVRVGTFCEAKRTSSALPVAG